MNVGKLYSVSFYSSSPWLLGCGGSGNELALWDMTRETAVRNRFGDRALGDTPAMVADDEMDNREQDFEAMMAAKDEKAEEVRKNTEKKKKGKKKGKGKKKAPHRKGR